MNFLKPFQSFTKLVSIAIATATVSVVPLVIRWKFVRCSEAGAINNRYSLSMKSAKNEDLGKVKPSFTGI